MIILLEEVIYIIIDRKLSISNFNTLEILIFIFSNIGSTNKI